MVVANYRNAQLQLEQDSDDRIGLQQCSLCGETLFHDNILHFYSIVKL